MKEVLIDLLEDTSLPLASIKIVSTNSNIRNIRLIALIDTGASIPVWVGKKETLLLLNAKLSKVRGNFSGFGGDVNGVVYDIPLFNVGELLYPNMPVILQDDFMINKVIEGKTVKVKPLYSIILSSSLFYKMIYEIDTVNSKFKITVPDDNMVRRIHVKSIDGELEVVLAQD